MSSFAPAPKRTADKEPDSETRQFLRLLSIPSEAPEVEESQAEPPAAATGTKNLDEAARVERLLSQLEARSLALVPYGYGQLREVPPARQSYTPFLAAGLIAVWLGTVVLGVAYIRYVNHSSPEPERARARAPLVIDPDGDPQEQKIVSSVDHLAQALVSSSERINELQAAMQRSNRDLQRIATKVNSGHPKTVWLASKRYETPLTIAAPVAIPANNVPKNWHHVIDVKPTDAAVPHKSTNGTIDYWLVQRGADQSPSKVLPIATNAEGVVVHNLDDGKDYTLTPAGEWHN